MSEPTGTRLRLREDVAITGVEDAIRAYLISWTSEDLVALLRALLDALEDEESGMSLMEALERRLECGETGAMQLISLRKAVVAKHILRSLTGDEAP